MNAASQRILDIIESHRQHEIAFLGELVEVASDNPPGEGWSVDPYGAVVKDGVMYGRGVAVSKSDFATYAFALKALEESGLVHKGAIELHLTYDEEVGGAIGPGLIVEQGLSKPDYVISAGFSYNVVVAHNGCLHLEVRVEGKSAHAARPDTGVDALEAATKLLTALYALRERYKAAHSKVVGIDHPTLTVGLISGGINTNVVPDVVTMRIDRRMIPEENPAEVERDLVAEIERVLTATPGIRVKTKRILLARPFTPQPGQEVLVSALQRHAKTVMGIAIPAEGVPLYTDARLYSAAGIPTALYGAGPRSLLEANSKACLLRTPENYPTGVVRSPMPRDFSFICCRRAAPGVPASGRRYWCADRPAA